METNINYSVVGAFVIILTTAIILAIIWLSSGLTLEKYTNYLVYMTESVSGLSVDSSVEYNGVGVGAVKNIKLNEKNPQLVEVLLSIKSDTPITRGTVATLTTRGLTGVAYVALKDKSTDLRPLLKEHGQKYPVIPTAPSIFMRLDAFLSRLSVNFQRMADSLQSLFDKENLRSIKATLHNLQKVTNTLAASDAKLTEIMNNTARASKQLGPLLQSGTGTMNTLQNQTLPATYELLMKLDDISQNLASISADIKQNPSILIRGTVPQPLGPGEKP